MDPSFNIGSHDRCDRAAHERGAPTRSRFICHRHGGGWLSPGPAILREAGRLVDGLFLCSVPLLFLEFSVLSHPDIPQVFFMVCGVYAGCRLMEERHWRWLNLRSVAAGLAFASKYSGLFLLHVRWIIALVHAVFLGAGQNRKLCIRYSAP